MLGIDVTLCGATSHWQFPGSKGLQHWLSGSPWLEEGGSCAVLGPAAPSAQDRLLRALRQAAHAASAEQDRLRLIPVEVGAGGDTPMGACLGALGVDWSAGKLSAAEGLARHLRGQRSLFLVELSGEDRVDWWESLEDFADIYHKRYPSCPLAVLVLSRAANVGLAKRFDFRMGWPSGLAVLDDALGERERWARYLHCRIAWEAGGSPAMAEALAERVRGLEIGDDERLEDLFNRHAQEWAGQIRASGATLIGCLEAQPADAAQGAPIPLLWWHPPYSLGAKPQPWVCRAALIEQGEICPALWRWRYELFCAPLARALFSLCLQAEASLRDRVLQAGAGIPRPSEEAEDLMRKFNQSGNPWYPANHPTVPASPWVFASLGEILKASPDRLPQPCRSLHELRNTLAHGHFIGWRHVLVAVELMRLPLKL